MLRISRLEKLITVGGIFFLKPTRNNSHGREDQILRTGRNMENNAINSLARIRSGPNSQNTTPVNRFSIVFARITLVFHLTSNFNQVPINERTQEQTIKTQTNDRQRQTTKQIKEPLKQKNHLVIPSFAASVARNFQLIGQSFAACVVKKELDLNYFSTFLTSR
jgi:hypothetical protein